MTYLESKGVKATRHWYEVWQEAQVKVVTVAGMTQLDLLKDVKAGLVDAVKNGKTEEMFIREHQASLKGKHDATSEEPRKAPSQQSELRWNLFYVCRKIPLQLSRNRAVHKG